jgi:ElaB/YqjD/DUF883 family membrane-anchored ribosome-binding protein
MKNILLVLLLSGLLLACGGNENNDEPEKSMSEQVEDAANDVADGAEEVANDVAEGAEEAANDVAEGAEEAADKVKEKVGDATTKFTKGGWTGKVVKLTDAITGNYESLNAGRVKELVMAGQYVGFLSDGQFYMVYNAAGNYDWKNLARVADQESVTIQGKVKKVGGMSVIMATDIAS